MKTRLLCSAALLLALGCGPSAPPPSPAPTGTPPSATSSPANLSATASPAEAPPPVAPSPAQAGPGAEPSPALASPSPGAGSPSPAAASPVATEPQDLFERKVGPDGSTILVIRGKGASEPAPSPQAAEPGKSPRQAQRPVLDPKDFGAPLYPKANVEGGSDRESETSVAVLYTDDPFDKVVAFYAGKMPGAERSHQAAGAVQTTTLKSHTTKVVVQQGGDRPGTHITLTTRH